MFLLAACPMALHSGCARSNRSSSGAAVKINDEEIPYSEFEAYLKASFGEEAPPAGDDETRSRLLDQFVEERLLLQKAQAERIGVSDEQVDSYLASLSGASPTAGAGKDEALREQVRRNLLIQEYKDKVLLKDVKVEPEEIEAYFKDHPEEFRQSRVVVLRQILLEDRGEAKQIGEELKQDPERFPILAQRASLSPDKGEPRPYEEGDLPESVRKAVSELTPGQISGEVVDGEKIRFLQMVDRREGKSQTLEESRRRIEVLLMQQKAEEALRGALAGFRSSAAIQIHRKSLPFSYRGDYGG